MESGIDIVEQFTSYLIRLVPIMFPMEKDICTILKKIIVACVAMLNMAVVF